MGRPCQIQAIPKYSPKKYENRVSERRNENKGIDWVYVSFCPRMTDCGYNSGATSNWIEAYNTTENIWLRLGGIPGLEDEQILKGFGMVAIGKSLFIIGGRICRKICGSSDNFGEGGITSPGSEFDIRVCDEVHRLDCVSNEWTECARLSTARVDFACSVHDGKIYVAGGRSRSSHAKGVSSAEVYDPQLDTWTVLPNMSTGRYKAVGVTWKKKIYVVGGFAGPEDSEAAILPFTNDRSSVEVFDPATGRWNLIRNMWQLDVPPNQIVTVDDRLYSSGDCLSMWKGHIEGYDSKLNMWRIVEGSHLRSMQAYGVGNNFNGGNLSPENGRAEQLYLTMAAVGKKLYFLGGNRVPMEFGRCMSTVHVFDTSSTVVKEHRWESFEPLEEEVIKELCSHCCVVTL